MESKTCDVWKVPYIEGLRHILEGSRRPQKSTKKSSIRDRFFRYCQPSHFEF
jgi:hypothetical protein